MLAAKHPPSSLSLDIMSWTTEKSKLRSRHGWKIFSSLRSPDRHWGPHSVLFGRHRGFFSQDKGPEYEALHSLLPSVKVENTWSYSPAPSYAFMSRAMTGLPYTYEGWNFNSGKLFIYNWYKIDTCFEVLLSFNVVTSIVYNPLPAMWKS